MNWVVGVKLTPLSKLILKKAYVIISVIENLHFPCSILNLCRNENTVNCNALKLVLVTSYLEALLLNPPHWATWPPSYASSPKSCCTSIIHNWPKYLVFFRLQRSPTALQHFGFETGHALPHNSPVIHSVGDFGITHYGMLRVCNLPRLGGKGEQSAHLLPRSCLLRI